MGALALATEPPSPEVLKQKPYQRTESLITRIMWTHILVQGSYQVGAGGSRSRGRMSEVPGMCTCSGASPPSHLPGSPP